MSGNREFKSDMFSLLLEQPEYALDVYNALNGSDYDDPALVIMQRLEDGISLSVRNDASFMLQTDINIYEHQSTYNPNMPLRGLIYFVQIINRLIKNKDLFSRRRIRLPIPHFVVFYNGEEKRPEVEVQRLSDSYEKQTDNPSLEVMVTVYNINPGCNEALKQKSRVLREYMIFVAGVKERLAKGLSLGTAIDEAIDWCIEHQILDSFLQTHRSEVTKAMTFDCTWEKREKYIREEEYEDGYHDGMERGIEQGIEQGIERGEYRKLVKQVCAKHAKGQSVQMIAEDLMEDEGLVEKICRAAEDFGPDYDVGAILERVCVEDNI